MAAEGEKISQFPTSVDIADTDFVPMVRPTGGGNYENYKVAYSTIVPNPTTPTLQEVTGAGNRTTDSVIVGGNPDEGEACTTITEQGVTILDPTIGQTVSIKAYEGVTTARVQRLQDDDGTIALVETLPIPDLDQVLTVGFTSAQAIHISDGAGNQSVVRTDALFSDNGTQSTQISPSSVQNVDSGGGGSSTFGLDGVSITAGTGESALYQTTQCKVSNAAGDEYIKISQSDVTVRAADGSYSKQATESFSVKDNDDQTLAAIRAYSGVGRAEFGNGTYVTTVVPDTQTISHVQTLQDKDGSIMLRQNQLMGEVTLISPGSATVSLPFDCSAWVPSLCFKIPDSGPTAYGFLIAYISTGPNRLNIYCLNSSGGSVPGSAGATVAWTLTEPY